MRKSFDGNLKWSDVTPKAQWMNRRSVLAGAGAMMVAGAAQAKLETVPSAFSTDAPPNSLKEITTYNNFYEFGTGKEDPAMNAGVLQTRPWTVRVEGLVGKPRTFGIDDLLKLAPLEERIYRLRCVEAWSMVVPWVGFPLAALLKQVDPLGSAKYVEFVTHYDPKIMTRRQILDWPYTEGLRLDEAMHPLTILAVGLYGEVLPNQNGAPVRLVVPWKYGFKSAKSIVAIRLHDTQPATAWNKSAPQEYGFYSNVNPAVDHPRWSQATERRIGEDGLLAKKRKTLMFNGYEAQVGQMYGGMDLKKFF